MAMSMMFDGFSSACSLDDLISEVEPSDVMQEVDQTNDEDSNELLELYRKSYQEALEKHQAIEVSEDG